MVSLHYINIGHLSRNCGYLCILGPMSTLNNNGVIYLFIFVASLHIISCQVGGAVVVCGQDTPRPLS